ncbi:MAG: AAA family ATPase [Chloroflexi bacterium]|nr:AAA family ATPase [Chloroflexota bacterium]
MIQPNFLAVENFRSIKIQRADFAPITVFYGANGTGKSSLLYSLLLMKNVILNLERQSSDFYNLGFTNLGDFRAVVHGHNLDESIRLYLKMNLFNYPVTWGMQIRKDAVHFSLQIHEEEKNIDLGVTHGLPYKALGNQKGGTYFRQTNMSFTWNGIKGQTTANPTDLDRRKAPGNANLFAEIMNTPARLMRNIAIAPLQMAFSRGEHSIATDGTSLNSSLYFSEDEIGTLLATRKYLQSPVSHYLEDITNRTLRVFSPPGDSNFSIDVEDRSTGLETELVNDGYGVNRIAWLLTLTLHDETDWMCIEEPETHLHPSAIRKLMHTFVEIIHKEEKRFLLTTHSETLILTLLSEVVRGNLQPEDVAFYLTRKEGKETYFERQEVNEHGQVEGGLSSFMEGELEEVATFFEQAN